MKEQRTKAQVQKNKQTNKQTKKQKNKKQNKTTTTKNKNYKIIPILCLPLPHLVINQPPRPIPSPHHL